MSVKHAILILEGPLQSWGLHSKFDLRDTAALPTKSGVIGMICSALGICRGDREAIAEVASLQMNAVARKRGLLITDFHTVGCGHIDKEGMVPIAKGGYKQVITKRQYLSDASFLVVLSGEGLLVDRCASALEDPVWSTYLGRRSCIPTRPVLGVVVDTDEAVVEELNRLGVDGTFAMSDGVDGVFQMDVPIDFLKGEYVSRSVVQESKFIR